MKSQNETEITIPQFIKLIVVNMMNQFYILYDNIQYI